MSEQTAIALETDLTYIFPDVVTKDSRPGYEGYLVSVDQLRSEEHTSELQSR